MGNLEYTMDIFAGQFPHIENNIYKFVRLATPTDKRALHMELYVMLACRGQTLCYPASFQLFVIRHAFFNNTQLWEYICEGRKDVKYNPSLLDENDLTVEDVVYCTALFYKILNGFTRDKIAEIKRWHNVYLRIKGRTGKN